jgi:hypothetical protein
MGRQIYELPIRLLFREFADRLKEGGIFFTNDAVNWFQKKYPKIKDVSVKAHLIRLTTNNRTRVHYKASSEDDLFFQLESGRFRKYLSLKDPKPFYFADKPLKPTKSRKPIRRRPMEERISDLICNFHGYLQYFVENIKFSGPSVYFHKKVIEKIRQVGKYDQLFADNLFFEYIYATLASWGMHRMGQETAKMVNFDEFKESICSKKEQLIYLREPGRWFKCNF